MADLAKLAAACPSRELNKEDCTCSATACGRFGLCCQCVAHHRHKRQLPGCFFSAAGEAMLDRSYDNFCKPGNCS